MAEVIRDGRKLLIEQDGQRFDLKKLPDGFVIKGDLDLSSIGITKLPDLSQVTVEGNFSCAYNMLNSLKGCPRAVGGDFECYGTNVKNLEGAPQTIGGNFNCSGCNELSSLRGAPQTVHGDFDCQNCLKLKNLEGAPKTVNGNFDCHNNYLTSVLGAPEQVNGNFNCRCNRLTTLEGAPKVIGQNFDCSSNRLTSLKGAPETICGNFSCGSNRLTTLEGAPEKIGGAFSCDMNRNLASRDNSPQEYAAELQNFTTPNELYARKEPSLKEELSSQQGEEQKNSAKTLTAKKFDARVDSHNSTTVTMEKTEEKTTSAEITPNLFIQNKQSTR